MVTGLKALEEKPVDYVLLCIVCFVCTDTGFVGVGTKRQPSWYDREPEGMESRHRR